MSSDATLKQIQDVFEATTTLYCSGSVPLEPATTSLFYLNDGKPGFVNFAKPTEEQLVALAEACQPETTEHNNEMVVDDSSSRKVGKMDTSQFATQFSPLTNGIIGSVDGGLLQGRFNGTRKSIRVELCKLNVYGPGSFSKPEAHVDTSSGKKMLGTLVVIFPTVHEGGSLILRHGSEKKVFDTAHALNSQDTPHAAFVAFSSDVEHEVAPIKSGYRVTLTYNLYRTCSTREALASGPDIDSTIGQRVAELQGLIKSLLLNPTFLPKGGFLGFGLSQKYPLDHSSSSSANLERIARNLKGGDAEVRRACDALGLTVSLKIVYAEDKPIDHHPCCLVDEFFEFRVDLDWEIRYRAFLMTIHRGSENPLVGRPNGMDLTECDEDWDEDEAYKCFLQDDGKPIVWLRTITKANSFNSPYIYRDNVERDVKTAYGNACLIVKVAKARKRVY